MTSSDIHRHRTRPSFMLALKKIHKSPMADQDIKTESPRSPLLRATSVSSGSAHSLASNSAKLTKESRRLSQTVVSDAIFPAKQHVSSSKQSHTLVQTATAASNNTGRKLVRVPPNSRQSKVIHSQRYPPCHVAPSHTTISSATVSASDHSEHSSAQLISECSDRGTSESLAEHPGPSLESVVEVRVRPSTDQSRRLTKDAPRRLSLELPSPSSTSLSSNRYSIPRSPRSHWPKELNTPRDKVPSLLNPVSEGLSGSAPSAPLSEKQRALNVKRAKKMAQVFGSEPPQALFQVSKMEEDEIFGLGKDTFGGSVTTLLLPSTNNLSSLALSPDSARPLTSSSSFTNSSTPTPNPESELLREGSSLVRSHTVPPSPTVSVVESKILKTESEFRRRRLRAAKLAKFFGVGYNDLQQHASDKPRTNTTVEVAVAQKGAFWERPQHHHSHHYEADMQDVLRRLREMKAST